MSEQAIEQEIQDKNLNAPRLTPNHITKCIVSADYYVFPHSTTTVCMITLKNGYKVIGESSPVSDDNFDAEIGRKVAFECARDKIWALEGYLLKDKLSK
ncbi:MAG: Gp49 family protein [Cetobacterium sp.]|uniref:Gp49 family protein n=1 Tax=Cetobacterium sp. TaxID=2071632 RepID=UPI003EE5C32E